MKRGLVCLLSLFGTAGAFGQLVITNGYVVFANRVTGYGITHVWGPSSNNPTLSLRGNGPIYADTTASDDPPGIVDYGAAGMARIGASGLTGLFGSATTFAQLLGAPGSNVTESLLLPSTSPATTFRTGNSIGNIVPSVPSPYAFFNNIEPDARVATFQMAAWDNSSGLYPSWTEAKPAWLAGVIAAGTSYTFNLEYIGGIIQAPPIVVPSMQSFNIYYIPEPMPLGLFGLSAALCLISRKRRA